MQLITEMLERFVGGQVEIQNNPEEYLFRGEIATIVVEDETVIIALRWMAKGVGYPSLSPKWVKDGGLHYAASLQIYTVTDIGPSPEGGGSRICLQSGVTGELVVLYPADGKKLDPSRVEGLVLV